MKKEVTPKGPCIRPMPSLIVSCRDKDGRNNALVVGFGCNVSKNPAMVMIGIVPTRFSYHMVKESGEFVINIPAKGFEEEYHYLGYNSGKNEDKFAVLNLAWEDGEKVNAPMLTACPVTIECKVVESLKPGTHELFIASVEAIHCEEEYLDENGNIQWDIIPFL